ncbi:Vsp/OspC family lipoprotein [Borrelia venezuelensis]|uniref:Vsp/OspC family lipoprotein n=1 Tax=Borrelia venezuelensis TaxID=1653839 RepID=UPI001FF60DEA|nr:Vsp/OspC family lipoprotein [Borrelia venezuelensis]UPA12812.1 vsp protein [Borrelia venezuelensis]
MKRITLCALLMTLFLLSSCNTSGAATKDGQAARSDGTLIDLVKVTKNIKDSVAFANDVKDVHTLVKSIDELAKAIGKKLKKDDGTFEDETNDNNGQLVVVAYSIISDINTKLTGLEQKVGIFDELKVKIADVNAKSKLFLDKLRSDELCKKDAKDDDIKKAIERTNADKTKGAKELGDLNAAIDTLLKAANDAVESAINELITPAKSEPTTQSN